MNKICRINKSIIIKIYCLKNYCFFYWNNLTRLDCKNTLKNYSECMLSYGENCQHHCNIHCINQTCDRVNGSCLFGCIYGKQCRKGMFLYFRYFPKMSWTKYWYKCIKIEFWICWLYWTIEVVLYNYGATLTVS